MKRFAWLTVLLFVLVTLGSAHADYFDLKFDTLPGDNLQYLFHSSSFLDLSNIGDICGAPFFCAAMYMPGTYLVPQYTVIDFEDPSGWVIAGGHAYVTSRGDFIQLPGLDTYGFVGAGFVFPLGGDTPSTFTKTVDAHFLGEINGIAISRDHTEMADFSFSMPPGKLRLTYFYSPAQDGVPAFYTFDEGEFSLPSPEPGSASLMATGLAGILAILRRRLSW